MTTNIKKDKVDLQNITNKFKLNSDSLEYIVDSFKYTNFICLIFWMHSDYFMEINNFDFKIELLIAVFLTL